MLEKITTPERGDMTDAEYIGVLESKLMRARSYVETLQGCVRRINKLAKEQLILIERIPEDYDAQDFVNDILAMTSNYPYVKDLKPDSVVRLYRMSGRGKEEKARWAAWRAEHEKSDTNR